MLGRPLKERATESIADMTSVFFSFAFRGFRLQIFKQRIEPAVVLLKNFPIAFDPADSFLQALRF